MNTIKIDSRQTRMIAHRGLSGIERENTNPAFVAAGNRSYFGIETDVHKTADGQFVIIHDETTRRVSEEAVDVNVEENPYDRVKDLVLPDLDGSRVRQDIRIPLLTDYIKICKKYEKVGVLELKNRFEGEDLLKIVEIIRKENYLDQVIFISFVPENCIFLREKLPEQRIQLLLAAEVTEEIRAMLSEYRLDLDIYHERVNRELVDSLHKAGVKINCWTCDNKEQAEALVDMGVDFITSNILE